MGTSDAGPEPDPPRGARDLWARVEERLRRGLEKARSAGATMVASRAWRRHARWVPVGALAGLFVLGLLWARCGLAGCPSPDELLAFRPGGAPALLDRDGEEIGALHPLERLVVRLDSLPGHVSAAIIAVEDRRFRSHGGVDWIRAVGAGLRNATSRGAVQGASTLTMQLARSVFPDRIPGSERSLRRKLLEARVAMAIERRYSKDEILELYLNHVYFGAGAHGIEAAARLYFGRPAASLDVAEAALVAGVVRAPSRYDPRRDLERATARRNLVLSLMEAQGRLSAGDAETARAAPIEVTPDRPLLEPPTVAPYFVEAVRQLLERELGPELYTPGVRIFTTLDPGAQASAEAALIERLQAVEAGRHGRYDGPGYDPSIVAETSGTPYLQGAVVVMDVVSGDVRALVGGRDFAHSRYNRAVAARRPVGSAFKPFVYAAAIRAGFVISQPIADLPFEITPTGSRAWAPRNHDGLFRGPVDMRTSLVRSLNVPTARLGLAVGIPAVVQSARDAGLEGPIPETPATVLGTGSHSPLEMAVAYASFAGGGARPVPRFVVRVEDANGRVLWEPGTVRRREMDPRIAYLVTDMLRNAVDRGTGTGVRAAGYRGPAAGKTGTTQEAEDAWFVGYTPRTVGAVWIGFDRGRAIFRGATGGALAAPVWGAVFAQIEGEEPADWPRPPGVVERSVDPRTGFVVAEGCGSPPDGAVRELFLAEAVPVEACPRADDWVTRFASALQRLFGRGRSEAREAEGGVAAGPPEETAEDADPFLGMRRVPLAGS